MYVIYSMFSMTEPEAFVFGSMLYFSFITLIDHQISTYVLQHIFLYAIKCNTKQARIIHEAMEAVASGPRFLPALKTGIIDRPELWEIFYGLLETIYIYIILKEPQFY